MTHLRNHYFKQDFWDSLNTISRSSKNIERKSHVVLNCPNYCNERSVSLKIIGNNDSNILRKINLHVSEPFLMVTKRLILNGTEDFLKDLGCFFFRYNINFCVVTIYFYLAFPFLCINIFCFSPAYKRDICFTRVIFIILPVIVYYINGKIIDLYNLFLIFIWNFYSRMTYAMKY